MVVVVVLAAGEGTRAGSEVPKQFVEVLGRPLLAWTLDVFEAHPLVDAIEVVRNPRWSDFVDTLICREGLAKVRWTCDGGEDFQASVVAGLANLGGKLGDDDIVLVHYGDSPMVSAEVVSDAIRVCRRHGNASPAMPATYLLAGCGDGASTAEYVDRDRTVRLNTPQAMRYGYARWLYEEGDRCGLLGAVDPHTTSLMLAMGERVWFSRDESTNVKVTYPGDFLLFEGWLLATGKAQRAVGDV